MDWNGISLQTSGKSEGITVSWPRKRDCLTIFCHFAEVSAGGYTSCPLSHLDTMQTYNYQHTWCLMLVEFVRGKISVNDFFSQLFPFSSQFCAYRGNEGTRGSGY